MKTIFTFLAAALFSLSGYCQGWTAKDLSPQAMQGNGSMVEHNGKLFVESAANRISVSTDGGLTFTDITTDTIYGSIRYMVSAGNRLYVGTFSPFNASGNLWYTTDEGVTWQTDTVGLPNHYQGPAYKRDIYALISYNNGTQLIASWGGADGYMRKAVTDAAWTKISFFDPIDPISYTASHDTVLAVNSSTVYYSTDNAATWTAMGKASLPSFFVPKGFDMAGGRIYLGTDATIQQKYKLHYTDDFGASWDTLPVNHLIKKSWLGQPQRPGTLKVIGSQVYLSLVNNKSGTPLNLISSNNRGATFIHDTIGLKSDQFGTGIIFKILQHQGKVFALNNFQTLYSKSLPLNLMEKVVLTFGLYPNPVHGALNLITEFEEPITIVVYGSSGLKVLEMELRKGEQLDVSHLPTGTYSILANGVTKVFVKQ